MDAPTKVPVTLEVRRTLTLALPARLGAGRADVGVVCRYADGRAARQHPACRNRARRQHLLFDLSGVWRRPLFGRADGLAGVRGRGDQSGGQGRAAGIFSGAAPQCSGAHSVFADRTAFCRCLGQEPEAVRLATGYIQAIAWGFVPALLTISLRGLLEGISNPRPVMYIAFLSVGFNALMNYLLMFGKWGFPELRLGRDGVRECALILV